MHKQPDFYFTLQQPQQVKFRRQRLAMHIMSSFFVLFYALQYLPGIKENWLYALMLFPVALALLALPIFKSDLFNDIHQNRIFRLLEIGFCIMGFLHFFQQNLFFAYVLYAVMAAICAYLLYIENRMLQSLYVLFTPEYIIVELPTKNKKISWYKLNNIVYKNNYLTFVYQQGQFNQYPVTHTYSANDLEAFHRFVAQHLQATP